MLFPMIKLLYFYIDTYWSGACNSMMPIYHGILFRYILNDLDTVPVASIAMGVICCSILQILYFCHKIVFIFYSFSGFFLNHVCAPHICNVC